ncbi:C40 family peptidase [Sporosarcina aquimarina]|uniref:NlpC/P60 family protein n=1 Tax=Sporosarcina aquimarina TaxID=114975 RepID=A0ABU4G2C6_9BACL|nr:NlpC/P60 family protein [Sporosarcina aquimarina]MDW0111119.1 NlpC/P60 family protein [Sporosarcina aquimarina]
MRKRFMKSVAAIVLMGALAVGSVDEASAASSSDIATYAKKFTGTPYKFGGTTTSGFDCSGYIRYVYNHANIKLPRTSAEQFKVGKAVSKDKLQPGDLVFFANTYKKGISHTGIYLGGDKFISAKSSGVTTANLKTHPYWAPKYAGARRMADVKVTETPVPTPKPAQTATGHFKDLPSTHGAYEAILALNKKGVINGYLDGTFKPEGHITRGHAAAMINRILKLKASHSIKFTDVSPKYAFLKDITALNEAGILKGYTNGAFGVDDSLTRTQLAVIVDRAFNLDEKVSNETLANTIYKDVTSTYWASDSIFALKALDQTNVFKTSSFNPGKTATRAEFSAAVYTAITK